MALRETLADIEAMIPRYSWEIMDEDQRDALIANVVLPRHGKMTSDGIELTFAQWGRMVGATTGSIRGRVQRLRKKTRSATDKGGSSLTTNQQGSIRSVRATLKQNPAAVEELLKDPEVLEIVEDWVLTDAGQTEKRPHVSGERREMDAYGYLLKCQKADEALLKNLPDYVPDTDLRAEARLTSDSLRTTADVVDGWVRGRSMADEVSAYLGGLD